MRIIEAEEYVETLSREQLLAMTDRIIREVADRGYFGDKIALDSITRIITGTNYDIKRNVTDAYRLKDSDFRAQ